MDSQKDANEAFYGQRAILSLSFPLSTSLTLPCRLPQPFPRSAFSGECASPVSKLLPSLPEFVLTSRRYDPTEAKSHRPKLCVIARSRCDSPSGDAVSDLPRWRLLYVSLRARRPRRCTKRSKRPSRSTNPASRTRRTSSRRERSEGRRRSTRPREVLQVFLRPRRQRRVAILSRSRSLMRRARTSRGLHPCRSLGHPFYSACLPSLASRTMYYSRCQSYIPAVVVSRIPFARFHDKARGALCARTAPFAKFRARERVLTSVCC
jgi:hypothetical protein